MKTIVHLLLFLLLGNLSVAQVNLNWDFTSTGPQEGRLIVVDNHHNSYILHEYGILTKLSPTGDQIYSKPDTASTFIPASMMFDHNQELLILGTFSLTSSGTKAMKIEKRDTSGTIIWQTIINTAAGNQEEAKAMTIDQNNDIYITGYNGGQFGGKFYTAKISSAGGLVWDTDYTGPYAQGNHTGEDIAVMDANNIYAIGTEYVVSSVRDIRLIKYNQAGDTVWTRRFSYHEWINQFVMTNDFGKKVQVDAAGNVYVLTRSDGTRSIIIKYDPNGNTQWIKEIEPVNYARYEDLIVDNTGVYTGGTEVELSSSTDAHRIVGVKLDFNGNIVWDSKYSGKTIQGKNIIRHGDGLVVSGHSNSCNGCEWNFFTIRFDANGDTSWTHEKSTTNGMFTDEPFDIATDNSGGIYITGHGQGSIHKMHTFKLFSSTVGIESNVIKSNSFSVFPNPTKDVINISSSITERLNYSLLSLDGKIILAGEMKMSEKLSIDLKNFKSGVYILRVSGESANEFLKIVKL